MSKLKIGQELEVEIGDLKRPARAVVTEIIPSVDPDNRTFQVKASLLGDSSGIMPGMFARCIIEVGLKKAVVIPEAAIRRVGQLEYVMVKGPNAAAAEVPVSTAAADTRGFREIISGLRAGQQFLSSMESEAGQAGL